MPAPCRVVILISGSGSNLQALIDAAAAGRISADIVGVISNRADAFGLQRATGSGIATAVVEHRQFPDRASFDRALAARIDAFEPDLVVLAGFMRILTDEFVNRYQGRLLNIHPSLLPNYPGLDTHRRAIEAGDAEAGATVHFVTAELDGGPAILHGRVPILAGDTAATLAERVLTVEHQIYPRAVGWFASGRLQLRPDGAWLDDTLLPPGGTRLSDC